MSQNWNNDFEADAVEAVKQLSSQFGKDLIEVTLHRKQTNQKITKQDVILANQYLRGTSQFQQRDNTLIKYMRPVSSHGVSLTSGAGVSLIFVKVSQNPDNYPIGFFIVLLFIASGLFALLPIIFRRLIIMAVDNL